MENNGFVSKVALRQIIETGLSSFETKLFIGEIYRLGARLSKIIYARIDENRKSIYNKTTSEQDLPKVSPKPEISTISENTPTVLPQDTKQPKKSLQKKTFWAKLWRNSVKPQIKRFAGLGLLGGTFTMIQINEFALAGVLLVLSLIPFTIQI